MNSKAKLFCVEYLRTKNAKEAARLAGFSGKVAHQRLLLNPEVKAYLESKMTNKVVKSYEEKENRIDWMTGKLKQIAEHNFGVDDRTTIAALAEIAKLEGLYAAEKRISVNTNLNCDPDVSEVRRLMNLLIDKNKSEC